MSNEDELKTEFEKALADLFNIQTKLNYPTGQGEYIETMEDLSDFLAIGLNSLSILVDKQLKEIEKYKGEA